MALAFTSLSTVQESPSDGTLVSGSISPPDGAVLYVTIAGCVPSSGSSATYGCSGLGGTWTQIGANQPYGGRRFFGVFRGEKATSWGTGTVTGTITTSGLQDAAMVVDQVTGVNAADPDDVPIQDAGSDNLTLADVGTPDAGDAVYVIACHEDGANSLACTGYAEVSSLGSLANIRQIKTFYDDSSPDETPNITSGGGGNAIGGMAFVIEANAGGGGGGAPRYAGHLFKMMGA